MGHQNPKAKGAGFERSVCQRLSLWVSGMAREDVFWRSAMSGGRATVRRRLNRGPQHTAHAGDITATHELGHELLNHFLIECKFYKDLKLELIVFGSLGLLDRIWEVPVKQAMEHSRMPMVVAKQNMKDELVFLTREGRAWLRPGFKSPDALPVQAVFPQHGIHVSFFRDLLANVDFELIRERVR